MAMAFTPSDFHTYYQLKPCTLRPYLASRGVAQAEPDAYHKLLATLGERHESRHLASLGQYFSAAGDLEATRLGVERGEAVIYQPGMRVVHQSYGEVTGRPDFFIRASGGYIIRDCKLSRRFSEEHHGEIFRQLELYGWMYEQIWGTAPKGLEAYMGDGQLQTVPYEPTTALRMLELIQELRRRTKEPPEPVGWSKCIDCGYNNYCWERARAQHDVALLPSVDQALARALLQGGVTTYDELLKKHTAESLADVQKTVGDKQRRVGSAAVRIMLEAEAQVSGKLILLKPPGLITTPNVAIFDVEGIPPHLDHAEKTYLWGLKVFGAQPRPYYGPVAKAGVDGDKDGWIAFLVYCGELLRDYGDLPLIHWSAYEKTQLRKYVDKYGDVDGVAARIERNLYDLYPIAQRSVVLPLPSYGLKLVERYAGFTRKLNETGGKWSMATYIEAVETDDAQKAATLLEQIRQYNEEDLDALRAVFQWLGTLDGS
jgi:predicted RecB family nuclease